MIRKSSGNRVLLLTHFPIFFATDGNSGGVGDHVQGSRASRTGSSPNWVWDFLVCCFSGHLLALPAAAGTAAAADRLNRVLTGDPAMGVFRHVDAGYERAQDVANERGVRIPGFNC